MIDFSQVLEIMLGSSVVEQITNSRGDILWSKAGDDPANSYFYVEDISGSDNTLNITNTNNDVYYSTDKSNWTLFNGTATIPANGKLYLKANINTWDGRRFSASGNHNVGGNIMSLLYSDEFESETGFPSGSDNNFRSLFSYNLSLINANNLILPATTLATSCYINMFAGCTSLTQAPALPATTLVDNCYGYMFRGCTSLTQAPALPATTLADDCYGYMFQGCTSLTTAPALPATTLATSCYNNMFAGCTSLTQAPELSATTLTEGCYASMFQGCTSLTTAPALPATTLVTFCYTQMFDGCSNLNSVTTYATSISAMYCLYNWLNGVASTGTFYNLGGATYPTGGSGIPTGWTEKHSFSNYFYMENTSSSDIEMSITDNNGHSYNIHKSEDQENWTSMGTTSSTALTATIPANSKLYLKCVGDSWSKINISANGNHNVGGNIMSLLYGDDFDGKTEFPEGTTYNFWELFAGNTHLISAANLILPPTVTNDCYTYTFGGCTSLTEAPILPATALSDRCYWDMFGGCTNLNSITTYAQTISATDCLYNWLNGVSATGTFYNMACTTYPSGSSGIPAGWTELHTLNDTINVTITNTGNYSGATYQIDSDTAQPINETGTTSFTVPVTATTLTIHRNGKGITDVLGICGYSEDSDWDAAFPVGKMTDNVSIDIMSLM